MPTWYGSSDWNPPASLLARLDAMSDDDRIVAENQFAQLVVVRIFRKIYSRLNLQQKKKFIDCVQANASPDQLESTFKSIIPDIRNEIHDAVVSVYSDIVI